ncbi:MAG: histidinol dehydrogenase [Myxococcales bacterium]|nr:histidinol dehydrogenase [Myxococcales bacterium]
MLSLISPRDPDYRARLAALGRRTSAMPPAVEAAARDIVAQVRAGGDAALRALTAKFEARTLDVLELPRQAWHAAAAEVAAPVRAALEEAAARIRAYHAHERYTSFSFEEGGVRLGCRYIPMERAGIYVPGGTALYPSTVLMTAIPARVAGVREVIMVTPGPSNEALAAAQVAGVDRIFHIGGAQAIAALAYGTESVPRVDKIVGPGNAYVTAAKRLVFGDVGIDAIAGPTEIVVAADASVPASWVAADLLAQAEHDVLAAPILVAVGREVAEAVCAELARQLPALPRRAIAAQAIKDWGLAIVVDSAAEAIAVVNLLAPEHAELALADARALAPEVTRAGAVFVGSHTPESVGDYIAGPSHVLPTGGSARFSSPLGVGDFIKRSSFIEYSAAALAAQSAHIERLTEVEGLEAHGRAVTIRHETRRGD